MIWYDGYWLGDDNFRDQTTFCISGQIGDFIQLGIPSNQTVEQKELSSKNHRIPPNVRSCFKNTHKYEQGPLSKILEPQHWILEFAPGR